ncbi:hypothetical protein BJ928_11198 [Rhizobium sp. WW_1]|nr:hypothetical protein BJ928_11198 [Rhizobium sp. WW_1]
MVRILKMVAAGICVVMLASGAFYGWPIDTPRKADGLQERMTNCDRNIDELMRLHDEKIAPGTGDRIVVEGHVKACLAELKNYFYVTVARAKLKAKGVSSF